MFYHYEHYMSISHMALIVAMEQEHLFLGGRYHISAGDTISVFYKADTDYKFSLYWLYVSSIRSSFMSSMQNFILY